MVSTPKDNTYTTYHNNANKVNLGKLSERIAYKRSVSEGMGVMEYNDNKAKNEWSQFYDELSGYLGGKK
ncbi:hypothetical protein [Helicobacter pylori]|uniref:hypothetical protein n=1 Tax=Helicobacter pylori TaxID=210 RepID=UPI00217E6A81|nr:hypothetical protein [Helicobacter pylori]